MDIKTLSFSPDTLTVQPDCGALLARNAATFVVSVLPLLRPGLNLEINLSSLAHIDGAGVGALLTCRHAMQRQGCTLWLTHVAPHMAEELAACGLQDLLATPAGIAAPSRWVH